jgi:serine protease AprX
MNPRRLFVSGLCALALVWGLSTPAAAQGSHEPKIDRALQDDLRGGAPTQSVIVTVKPGYRSTLREALQKHGDRIKSEHPLIESLTVDLHSEDLAELAKQPWVESLAADAIVSAKAAVSQGSLNTQWSTLPTTFSSTLRPTLGLPAVPTSTSMTGLTGVAVAVVDSGIAPNEDFGGRIVGFYDYTQGGIPTAPYDDYGHGTHVAGLIGSSGKLSNYQYVGVAPDVRLVGFKVLDSTGQGKTSDVIKAIEYIVANRAKLNVQIINLSLGHPIYAPAKYDPLVQAVEKASEAGLIVVASAGNFGQMQKGTGTGYTGITSPGNAPSAITVGAVMTQDTTTRDDDRVAPYSSRGPTWFDASEKPDVVAPGHNLVSDTSLSSYLYKLLKASRVSAKNGQPLLTLSGSSMATAVASGVVALLVQQHNQSGFHRQLPLTPNLAKAMLQYSAIKVADGSNRLTQGAGEINAAGALTLAAAINTGDSGGWWLANGVTPVTYIGPQSYGWSKEVIYGDRVLTGDLLFVSNPVWTSNIVWGTNVVWGTSAIVLARNIVWGTNVVWGTQIVWGDRLIGQIDGANIVWGTRQDGDNVVWGTLDGDNVVWGTMDGDNIVWGTWDGDNIVWGTSDGDNVVWGTSADGDNVVWGTSDGDNVVWGTRQGAR